MIIQPCRFGSAVHTVKIGIRLQRSFSLSPHRFIWLHGINDVTVVQQPPCQNASARTDVRNYCTRPKKCTQIRKHSIRIPRPIFRVVFHSITKSLRWVLHERDSRLDQIQFWWRGSHDLDEPARIKNSVLYCSLDIRDSAPPKKWTRSASD